MIEKLFGVLPDWAQNKLVIRMTYTAGSFITARIISFLTGDYLNHAFAAAMAALSKVGIHMVIQVVSVDKQVLEAFVTAGLMIGSEWVIQHFHDNHVVPVVAPAAQQAAQIAVEPPKA